MHMELSESGCLTMILTDADLLQFGLCFEELDYDKPETRNAIQALLAAARRELGFQTTGSLLVEALPIEGGCLLMVTPAKAGRRMRMKRAAGPFIYAVPDEDALLQLAAGWPFDEPLEGGSSLYAFDGGYRLVLYGQTAVGSLILEECAKQVGEGDAAAAFTAEHGHALLVGDALTQLCAAMHPSGSGYSA